MKNGNQYSGNFFKGKFNGYGVFEWKNKSKYEGHWVNEKKHGKGNQPVLIQGKYTYDNGDVYEGDFCNDIQSGFGTLTKDNGLKLQRYM